MAAILHVTDFHIADPTSVKEPLRQGFYKEYVRALCKALKNEHRKPIDSIVATGDFVDRGNVKNFAHAREVLNFLSSEFEVPSTRLFLSVGNHDFERALDSAGKPAEARMQFSEFCKGYGNAGAVKASSNNRAQLCRGNGTWYLMVDSTLGCLGGDSPGTLEVQEVDEIMSFVKEIPAEELLIVGTHYPVALAPGFVGARDDRDWYARHVWVKGDYLRERVRKWRNPDKATTIWLCGDIHKPDHATIDDTHYVITGRLGTRVEDSLEKASQIRRQAKLIVLEDVTSTPKVLTLTYEPQTYDEDISLGVWKALWEEIRTPGLPRIQPTVEETEEHAEPLPTMIVDGNRKPRVPPLDLLGSDLEKRIGSDVEKRIEQTVKEQRLYSQGRFNTSQNEASLTWISIGPLLNTPGILATVITTMQEWVLFQLNKASISRDKAFFVGLDCWGSVLATQLAVALQARAWAVPSRSRGEHYSEWERISTHMMPNVKMARAVFLLSDVVTRGESISYVHSELDKRLEHPKPDIAWYSLSLISDKRHILDESCSFLTARATACSSIPILSFRRNILPDEELLPATLSLI